MKSYQQFLENAEQDEEKNGLDFDHDSEKGESSSHKSKVKAAKAKMLEFFEKRKAGAAKIAVEAKAKGGPSMLTYWHFSAKAQPYSEVISAIKSNKEPSFFLQKCQHLAGKLKFKTLKQEEFQKIMGQLEVYGEAYSQLFS
jgi:hypothetical protein